MSKCPFLIQLFLVIDAYFHLNSCTSHFILGSWGSVLLIIFYVENLDDGSWGVKNDV